MLKCICIMTFTLKIKVTFFHDSLVSVLIKINILQGKNITLSIRIFTHKFISLLPYEPGLSKKVKIFIKKSCMGPCLKNSLNGFNPSELKFVSGVDNLGHPPY